MGTLPSLLLFLLLVTATRSQSQDELLMVQSVTRHGDRAASGDVFITPVAPFVFFRGLGQLSNDGISHASATGAAYRARYGSFIDQRLMPDEIDIVGSSVDRVLMSAGSFSAGLFRTATNAPVQGPIFTKPYPDDRLLAAQFDCTNGFDDLVEKYNLPDSDEIASTLLSAMRAKEWECDQPPAEQSDTLLSEYTNPLTNLFLTAQQKACAQDKARKFMLKYLEQLGGGGSEYNDKSAERFQRTVGELSRAIASNFTKKSECYKKLANPTTPCDKLKKARFYYSHDVNLLALMNSISAQLGAADFYNGNNPAFSSSITLELWGRAGNVTYVKAFVRDGDGAMFTDFRFCDFLPDEFSRVDGFCTTDSLERAIAMYITDKDPLCLRKADILPSCCTPLGIWSEWTTTGVCATTCGSYSTAPRTRTCLSEVDGCPCAGVASDSGPCGIALCPKSHPDSIICNAPYVSSLNGDTLDQFCGQGDTPAQITDCSPSNCCPTGGIWSEWAPVGTCPTTCGSCSTVPRTRTCASLKDGCKCSGSSTGFGPCNTITCDYPAKACCEPYIKLYDVKTDIYSCGKPDDVEPPPPKVPCCPESAPAYWADWSEWSNTCLSKGGKTRTRVCNGASKGCPCQGDSIENQACCCPTGGVWSEWTTEKDTCNTICGACESYNRTRTCESEKFGCPCTAAATSDFGPCNRTPCESPTENGTPCCEGYSVMTNPNSGASYCGTADATIPLSSCCANDNESKWSDWSALSGDCNISKCGLCDKQKRTRVCLLGPEQCMCEGEAMQTNACGSNKPCQFPSKTCCAPYIYVLIGDEHVCA